MMDALPARSGWRVPKPTAAPLEPSLEGLLEEGVDALPVRITILQDEVVTGWDDGALGFEDDAVWFSGRATSFRVRAPDTAVDAYPSAETMLWQIHLRHPTRAVVVSVDVLAVPGRDSLLDEAALDTGVERLLGAARDQGGEPSQYPPLAPRPGLVQREVFALSARAWPAAWGAIIVLGLAWHPMLILGPFLLGLVWMLGNAYEDPARAVLRQIAAEEAIPPAS